MTSIEKETGKAFSVVNVARALEKLALDTIIRVRVPQQPRVVHV